MPRSFFAQGIAAQGLLSYRWLKHHRDLDYMMGLEAGWGAMNSRFTYHRKHYLVYTDANGVVQPSPSVDFSYRLRNKGLVGGMVGYQVNPEDMLLFKVHYVSSLFKRAGFEADTRPGDIAPNTVYRYFGRNFSRRIAGWQFTLGNDLALSRSLGMTLSCSLARYGSIRIEDKSVELNQAGHVSVHNNYYNYRVTDTGYHIGLRYRLG